MVATGIKNGRQVQGKHFGINSPKYVYGVLNLDYEHKAATSSALTEIQRKKPGLDFSDSDQEVDEVSDQMREVLEDVNNDWATFEYEGERMHKEDFSDSYAHDEVHRKDTDTTFKIHLTLDSTNELAYQVNQEVLDEMYGKLGNVNVDKTTGDISLSYDSFADFVTKYGIDNPNDRGVSNDYEIIDSVRMVHEDYPVLDDARYSDSVDEVVESSYYNTIDDYIENNRDDMTDEQRDYMRSGEFYREFSDKVRESIMSGEFSNIDNVRMGVDEYDLQNFGLI